MNNIKKVLLISSGQPSCNPRLVKEATHLFKVGFEVCVLYCPLSPWADENDKLLFNEYKGIEWVKVGYHEHKERYKFLSARIRKKINTISFKLFGKWNDADEKSYVTFSQELKSKALLIKAEIYIGHNLGALPAVVSAAKKNGGKAIFDFEDFHRGEDDFNSMHYYLAKNIEDKYIKQLDLAYTASPLITEQYKKLYPSIRFETINNCFPINYKANRLLELDGQLKLFWFSQYIGKNRGLEQIIEAMGLLKNKEIQLSLLGNIKFPDREYFSAIIEKSGLRKCQIQFLNPVPENQIVEIASQHHIGLAVEVQHVHNRDLCLTNKLFMYLLGGNAILYSNTSAQKEFHSKHNDTGCIFDNGNIEQIAILLSEYCCNVNKLKAHRLASFELAEELNWDVESSKYMTIIETLIK